jgi:hypothetical protein
VVEGSGDVSVLPGLVGVREMGIASSEVWCGSPRHPGATAEGYRGYRGNRGTVASVNFDTEGHRGNDHRGLYKLLRP